MNVEAFLDTNIFLYAASKGGRDQKKAERAMKVIRAVNFGMSMQVVQEFYHNVRVKANLSISETEASMVIELMLCRPLVIMDLALFHESRSLCHRYQLRYWDAAMLAAAIRLKATVCYSEDLNEGQYYDGLKVVNPFKPGFNL